jgi:hypothetical protein
MGAKLRRDKAVSMAPYRTRKDLTGYLALCKYGNHITSKVVADRKIIAAAKTIIST